MTPVRGVICDFGGVLTNPLSEAFAAVQRSSGIPVAALGSAMARVAEADGAHPLFELETGRMSEADFLDRLARALEPELGRAIELRGYGEAYFSALVPNTELIEYMAALARRGLRMALLTNNVREWQPRWRAMLPVDDIFPVVVDSAFVGVRKPDPEIYELTLERIGLTAPECVFVDDTDVNCEAAEALGMTAVRFDSTAQTIAEVDAALDGSPPATSRGPAA